MGLLDRLRVRTQKKHESPNQVMQRGEGELPFVKLKKQMFLEQRVSNGRFTADKVEYWWWETIEKASPTYRALVKVHENGEWRIVESDQRADCSWDLIRHWSGKVSIGYEIRLGAKNKDGDELDKLITKYRGY
jgi:hypothetical protein